MMTTSLLRPTVVACFIGATLTAGAAKTSAQTVTSRVPGDPANTGTYGGLQLKADSDYDNRGAIWRFLFGENWREVWAVPVTVPYLDLNTFAGGLTPYKSGGNQTRTLHFHGKDGRHYVFRSVGKSVQQSLGKDLEHTPVGDIIQDQNSANHPSSATIANVVQNVTGVLHPSPTLVVLPDVEALGEYRKVYANMLGHVEIDPDDVPDGVEQFGHADKIVDADKLLESLEKSTDNRLDARAYLKDRLVDAIMGDFDRGADQWDFARYDKDGLKTFVPIARDRDWAFMRANGAAMREIRHIYAKIGSYDPENEKLRSITFMTHEFDRSHLVGLPWSAWQEVAGEITARLTDDAIEAALNAQPSAYNAVSAQRIREGLRARRDGLQQLAREFFEMVNLDADVFAADEDERADIERNADGSLHVKITKIKNGAVTGAPYFERTFLPKESEEVRVYMQDGDDQVVVRGAYPSSIKLRVVGGAGDDMLVDSTGAQRGEVVEFYDASGNNKIMSGPRTDVHTRAYVTAQPTTLDPNPKEKPAPRKVQEERRGHFQDQWRVEGADFTTQRTQTVSTRFWGGLTALAPLIDLRDGAGVVLGAGLLHTAYGFRSLPYASRIGGHFMYATSAARPGADIVGQFFPANHDFSLSFRALASGFESQRFYGYGNATALIPEQAALILHNELRLESSIAWGTEKPNKFSIGPVLRVIDSPHFMQLSPAALTRPFGAAGFSAAGVQASLTHEHVDHSGAPHRGYRMGVTADALDAIHNGDGIFGNARATVSGYVPLGGKPTLALRVGGERAFGSFPIQDAAQLGGRFDLRGYRWNRYSGDATLFGNAEIRAPLTRVTLLVRGDLGAIALADVGRVWMDGTSNGDWHHSFGGGLSFSSLSKAVSVVWAHGEENRVYLNFGLPF